MTSSGLAGKSARASMALAQAAAALIASLSMGADAQATVIGGASLRATWPKAPPPDFAIHFAQFSAPSAELHLRPKVDDRAYPLFGLGGLTVRPVAVGDLLRCLLEPAASPEDANPVAAAPAISVPYTDCPTNDFADSDALGAATLQLAAPVGDIRISSPFGMRLHPILGFTRLHEGVDFAADEGTPVLAAGDGVIEEARWAGDYGRWLKIGHGRRLETGYAHLSAWAPGISPGVEVHRGEVVAYVGASGLATGPHLHFEVLRDGQRVDPLSLRHHGRRHAAVSFL
jgi:murein DD-endopeptidase MepM/ murein hydrolase activator NlpD